MGGNNRVFRYALGASIALHALLLLSFPDLMDRAREVASIPPQIIARLMAPAPEPVPVPAPEPQKPVEKKEPKPQPKKPAPVLSAPQPVPAPVPAPPAEAPVAAVPVVPPAPPPQAAVQPQGSAPTQPSESLSRDQYRLQLIDEARRHKRYPPLARENNWQGDVRIGVAVAASGRPTVTLKASSGYEVLDRQALEMFGNAARAVPVPPPLRGKEFALEVRAVYGLED
ncbi:MAG TPA: energy transducer TonB [Burkholderiales bacterium]|nr:energy transducer TonB [Burkholderiales bacterium]